MLKRNDLSKQFELVVQQEIKNFNEGRDQINQSINDLRVAVFNLEKQFSANYALVESKNKLLEIELELLSKSLEKGQKSLENRMNDADSQAQIMKDRLEISSQSGLKANLDNEKTNSDIESFNQKINSMDENVKGYSLRLQNGLEQIKFDVTSYMGRFKQDILNLPSESEALKKEFNEKLTEHKVDVKGIMKEIHVNRKEFMVIGKQLENIYTLIDRLQKAEVTQ